MLPVLLRVFSCVKFEYVTVVVSKKEKIEDKYITFLYQKKEKGKMGGGGRGKGVH